MGNTLDYQDIALAARELPVEQRLALIEELAHSLVEEWRAAEPGASSLDRLRGVLTGADAPSSHSVREAYTDYLIEKYR